VRYNILFSFVDIFCLKGKKKFYPLTKKYYFAINFSKYPILAAKFIALNMQYQVFYFNSISA